MGLMASRVSAALPSLRFLSSSSKPLPNQSHSSLRNRHVRDGKLDAAIAAAHFDEDLCLEQVSERHAGRLPCVEVLSDGDRSALTGSFPNAVVLRPVRYAVAPCTTRSSRLARVEDVVTPIDLHSALVAGVAR